MPEQPKPRHEARPSPEDEDAGRKRLASTLRHGSRAQVVVAVLLAVLGFTAIVQVRNTEQDNTYAGLREQDLIEILNALTGTAERARRERDRLEQTRDELQSENTSREAALSQTQERARTLNIIAGLVPVTGPGIRITIEEGAGPVSVGSLLDIVQEMRTADAEAIEFNDEHRVVAQSSFNEAVGGIELDGNLLEPPYVIEVIGDPHSLNGGLSFAGGPIETLEQYDGATVEVEELESIDIESVREFVRPVNAEADTGQ
ncbi:hypothetical protein ASG88_16125 [Nocardioides sp. Soil777]|jgi:uncharacterized protein YlxW (UPF0749 family)|uniref:DUF881 domain-containing protein n=1 Tax=Nocardioides sp. Soil777 TaxID=1736409 RepID=UPI0007025504|nr:DUF881 domain-containing protein [Nocardioides sp. Soil777]KRE99247.1 hypothetical protein ASG88_16125 [Nocardioides sp. Soil777]